MPLYSIYALHRAVYRIYYWVPDLVDGTPLVRGWSGGAALYALMALPFLAGGYFTFRLRRKSFGSTIKWWLLSIIGFVFVYLALATIVTTIKMLDHVSTGSRPIHAFMDDRTIAIDGLLLIAMVVSVCLYAVLSTLRMRNLRKRAMEEIQLHEGYAVEGEYA